MVQMKSLEEFQNFRDLIISKPDQGKPCIILSAGTCGQASGANDIMRILKRQILERDYGVRLVNAKQVIKAVRAADDLMDILKISKDAALLFIERISFSQVGLPVEFLRIFYRADRYTLYNELHD